MRNVHSSAMVFCGSCMYSMKTSNFIRRRFIDIAYLVVFKYYNVFFTQRLEICSRRERYEIDHLAKKKR